LDPRLTNMADAADGLGRQWSAELQRLTDGPAIRQVLPAERLIDDRDPRRVGTLLRQELASGKQRRADCLEVAVADVEHLRTGRIVSRTKDEARRQESDALAGTANRNVRRRADTQDAGNRPYLVDHVAIKLLIVLVTRRAHREIYDQ